MKLTEKQLANMFRLSKKDLNHDIIVDLKNTIDASEKRLLDVEKITNNSLLSASHQVINQIDDWNKNIINDIKQARSPSLFSIFNWFKSGLTVAAVITAVYFITPQTTNHAEFNPQHDKKMFTSSFEDNSDVIQNLSFDKKQPSNKADSISKSNFS